MENQIIEGDDMLKKILIAAIIVCFYSVCLAEFGQRFQINDFDLHVAATQLSKKIIVSGDVKGGQPCKLLNIQMSLSDDKGHTTYVRAYIKNYKHSGKFKIKKTYHDGGYWTVNEVHIFN